MALEFDSSFLVRDARSLSTTRLTRSGKVPAHRTPKRLSASSASLTADLRGSAPFLGWKSCRKR